MQNLPFFISILFLIATAFSLWFLLQAFSRRSLVLWISLGWLTVQAILGITGFYHDLKAVPPHFIFMPVPPMLFILGLFAFPKSRRFLDNADIRWLTWLHVVRIPVEFGLYALFLHGGLPKIMTFEGGNFDIASGITAVFVAWYFFRSGKIRRIGLLLWNLICLMLLINIVYHAVFSTPYPFQKFGFEQPNVAIFYFPFNWLPSFIVPVVFLSHIVSIYRLAGLLRKPGNPGNGAQD